MEKPSVITLKVKVFRICFPTDYYLKLRRKPLEWSFVVFEEKGPRKAHFSGNIMTVDPLHEYTLEVVEKPSKY